MSLPLALVLSITLATVPLAEAALCAAPTPPADAAAAAYTLDVPTAPIKVKKGQAGTARIAVVPRGDGHVDPNAPAQVSLSAGPALELSKAKLSKEDARFENKGLQFDLPFTAKAAGPETLKANLTFFICTANLCERQKKEVVVNVLVTVE